MRKYKLLVVPGIVVAAMLLRASGGDVKEPGRVSVTTSGYTTVAELRKATQDKLKEVYEPYKGLQYAPPDDIDAFAFLAECLDGKSAEIRAEATRLIADLPYEIRATLFDKYLSDRYPLPVQMVALSRSMQKCGAGTGYAERMGETWGRILNASCGGPVAPPYFAEVVGSTTDVIVAKAHLTGEVHSMLARRMLYLLSSVPEKQRGKLIVALSTWVDKTSLADEIVAWYSVEHDASVRRLVLWEVCIQGNWDNQPTAIVKLKQIASLAGKDWDAENVRLSKQFSEAIGRFSRDGAAAGTSVPGRYK